MSTTTAARPPAPGPGTTANSRWPAGHPRRRLILLVLCLSLLVVVIDNTILNTALPTLARVLHAGTSSLQWITDAYTLCFAALLIPAGALGDRYGRRLSLLGGLTVFALGSAAAAFASGTAMLTGARVVMGLGAAFVMPATLSILNAVFPPKERPQAIAAWSAVTGIGVVIGPTLGGLLLTHFWWGSVFLINIPLVAVALAGVILTVPETAEPGGHRLDIPGAVLVGGALFAIVDAIIEAPGRGWTGTATLAETAAGLAALAVFTWWELRIAHPLVDLRIFASRAFSTAAASVTVIFFALFGSLFVLTQYLQLVHGYSPLSAGLRALPFALAIGATSPLSPILASRFGTGLVIPAGMALMGLGLLDLSTAGVHTAYPPLALAVAIMGAGMGLVMAPASTTIMTTVPARQAGAGSAINDTIREVGGALGIAIVGSLAAAVYRSQLTHLLTARHAPGLTVHIATSSVAAADAAGQQAGGAPGSELVAAAHSAFVNAMAMGVRVAAGVALISAVAAIFALPQRREPQATQVALKLGEGGEEGLDNDIARATYERTGVSVMGKRMFDAGELAWPEEAPFHTPVFVVTHTKRDPWERPGGTTFHFVNDGISSALDQAREAAGDRDVRIAGGAETIQEYLDSGLIDEFSITLAPVLFGTGIRLFDRVDPARLALDQTRTDASSRVTHLTYTVGKR